MIFEISKNRGLSILELIFISFCVVFFLVPNVEKTVGFVVFSFIEIIYAFIIYSTEPINVAKQIRYFFLTAIFVGILYGWLQIPVNVTTDNAHIKNFANYFYFYSCMYFPVLLLYRVLKYASFSQIKFLLILALVVAVFWSYGILKIIAENPIAARSFGHGQSGIDDPDWIAPFYFVYGMTFMVLLFLYFSFYNRFSPPLKYMMYFFVFFWSMFLIKAQFTLAILVTIISFLYMRYNNEESRDKKNINLIKGLLILIFTPLILSLVVGFLPDTLSSRFSELMSFSSGQEMSSDSDLMVRLDLYGKCIKSFVSSPLIGHRYLNYDGHATALYLLAELGLLGGIPIYKAWFRVRNIITNLMGNAGYVYRPFFVLYMLNLFTNPIHPSLPVHIMLNFCIPLSIIFFKDKLRFIGD